MYAKVNIISFKEEKATGCTYQRLHAGGSLELYSEKWIEFWQKETGEGADD